MILSDLGVFPGTHSVLWEQSCASALPCIFRRWIGMQHVDIGGNCILLDDVSVVSIKNTINSVLNNKEKYDDMRDISINKGMKIFSYREIAKKAIEK